MTNNEIILEYLRKQKEQQEILIADESRNYIRSEWCNFYKPKIGYTLDDFNAMSNEIDRLGEQVKLLQELCSFLRANHSNKETNIYISEFNNSSFRTIRNQIIKDLDKNK